RMCLGGGKRGRTLKRTLHGALESAEGLEEFGGGDDLAGVALGVVGDVNQEAAGGGGGVVAGDGGGGVGAGGGGVADTSGGSVDGGLKFFEEFTAGAGGIGFGVECGELRAAKRITFGVGEETVEAAGDVADMEGDRRESVGLGVKIFVAQPGAPVID